MIPAKLVHDSDYFILFVSWLRSHAAAYIIKIITYGGLRSAIACRKYRR